MTDNAIRQRPSGTRRNAGAAVLLILGVLLPWNVHFGLGITGTPGWLFAVLVVVTAAALAALAIGRLRSLLTIPYFVVVLGFVLFAVIQSIRHGGTAEVAPGVGPGAWLGLAGALLAARPVTGSVDAEDRTARLCTSIAVVSLVLGVAATVFNLYWRTRFVLPAIGDPDVGGPSLATAIAALLYGLVAVLPLAIGYRWLRSTRPEARLATVLLGASVLVAGVVVWLLPVGRDLDAFHGIAQSTGTTGVGFEGYLAWVAVAALVGIAALRGRDPATWRGAARKCLLLIAVWCFGTAVLRIADVVLAAVLDLPSPPYNGTALMAFDLLTAVLAGWLFINGAGRGAPGRLMTTLFVGLFAATVCRLIVGVVLIPRVQPLGPVEANEVFGNTLAQQITGTFDVVVAVLAFAVMVIAVLARPVRPRAKPARVGKRASAAAPVAPAEPVAPAAQPAPAIVVPGKASAETSPEPAPARIVRPDA